MSKLKIEIKKIIVTNCSLSQLFTPPTTSLPPFTAELHDGTLGWHEISVGRECVTGLHRAWVTPGHVIALLPGRWHPTPTIMVALTRGRCVTDTGCITESEVSFHKILFFLIPPSLTFSCCWLLLFLWVVQLFFCGSQVTTIFGANNSALHDSRKCTLTAFCYLSPGWGWESNSKADSAPVPVFRVEERDVSLIEVVPTDISVTLNSVHTSSTQQRQRSEVTSWPRHDHGLWIVVSKVSGGFSMWQRDTAPVWGWIGSPWNLCLRQFSL